MVRKTLAAVLRELVREVFIPHRTWFMCLDRKNKHLWWNDLKKSRPAAAYKAKDIRLYIYIKIRPINFSKWTHYIYIKLHFYQEATVHVILPLDLRIGQHAIPNKIDYFFFSKNYFACFRNSKTIPDTYQTPLGRILSHGKEIKSIQQFFPCL